MSDYLTQFYHTCWMVLKAAKPKLARDMALIEHAESASGEFDIAKAWFRLKHERPRLRKLMDDTELDLAKIDVTTKPKPESPAEDKKNATDFRAV